MMYPFMTLDDNTEITHSEMKPDGRVKVYIETPNAADGFHHLTLWLPSYELQDAYGYSEREIANRRALVMDNAHLMLTFAQHGGILNATSV